MPVPTGEVAVIEVGLLTVNIVAGVAPNVTAVAPVKPDPAMVTTVPPPGGPVLAVTEVTTGADSGVIKLNRFVPVPVPAGVVTATLAKPAACAVVVAVIDVELTNVTAVGALPPIVTEVAPVKLVPVMVTKVPPRVVPVFGEIAVTVGGPCT